MLSFQTPGWILQSFTESLKKNKKQSKWSETHQLCLRMDVCSRGCCSGFLPLVCVMMAVCSCSSGVARPRLSSSGVSVCTAQSDRWGHRIILPLHRVRSVRFCVSLRVVCITGVVYFGVCALSAVAARHGDPESVRVLQFHLVLIRHFDEGTPCKGVTETCTKPKRKEKKGWVLG